MPINSEYLPDWPQEVFIRRLLTVSVNALLEKYGRASYCGASVLDVGCGSQPFRVLLESNGFVYSGMDCCQNADQTIQYICPIDQALPSALADRRPFDLILCTEVLEHVPDWDCAFRNLWALTAEGGHVILTAPHFYQLHEEPNDYWRPTIHAFRHYAFKSGFVVKHEERAGDAWDVMGTLFANCAVQGRRWRIRDRVSAWFVRRLMNIMSALIRRGWLQSRVRLLGPLYLSNIVVLYRPPARQRIIQHSPNEKVTR